MVSHLPFTILAYLFNALSVTIDKFLLNRDIPSPLHYVFFVSLASLLTLLALPFTHIPSTPALILASTSTLLWTTGAYLMFSALKVGSPTRVIPLIGSLIPIILLVVSLNNGSITGAEGQAILVLILGMVVLTSGEWHGFLSGKELLLEVSAALFFAISYLVLKQAYGMEDFLTILVWSRVVLIPILVFIVLVPETRRLIFQQSKNINLLPEHQRLPKLLSKTGALFILGQSAGGVSEILLTYSISLATPALVNSLQGVQYGFIFLFSLILAKRYPLIFQDQIKSKLLVVKVIGLFLIADGLYLLAF